MRMRAATTQLKIDAALPAATLPGPRQQHIAYGRIWIYIGDVVVMEDWTTVDDRDPFPLIEVTKALPFAIDAIDIPQLQT